VSICAGDAPCPGRRAAASLHQGIDRRSSRMVDCMLWASGAAYLLETPAVQQRWTPEEERPSWSAPVVFFCARMRQFRARLSV
jgi:hypothetical protein